jgi:hypothetical protein
MERGPVPKRSSERIRRNKDDVEVETIEMVGEVEIPELGLDNPHPLVVDLYESLKDSGQSKYYEPSDWAHARIVCHFLDRQIKTSKPSGQMLAVLHSMMTDLLISEGARRRVRLEIEREQKKAQVFDAAARFRQAMEE